ncbi:hypothetical protein [Pseudoblastomonas halimionae]|uniref:Uncharacterized protein n=1 Tax=Alteriqipengyuania halimionae TaxID=1926630 RepID=A0A6I4U4G4_9SPHN|nr:hypothetical protein [Alteriqipengyuania halimionae]MXP09331.1 hypothetical protein [Alteriqipengyuania halimionae]
MTARLGRGFWWVVGGCVVLLVLVVAWIDGGERQLEPIVEEIPVPESAQ